MSPFFYNQCPCQRGLRALRGFSWAFMRLFVCNRGDTYHQASVITSIEHWSAYFDLETYICALTSKSHCCSGFYVIVSFHQMLQIPLVRFSLMWNFENALVRRFFTNSLAHAFSHTFWSLMTLIMQIWLMRIFPRIKKNVRAKDWSTLNFWNRLVNEVTILPKSEITLILGGQQ